MHFTHLHLHSEFSLLDGAISINKLVEFGKEHNFKSLAITDHGNIFGAVKFFQKCKKAGIKPILGMEAYFIDDASIKNSEKKYYHLIILVQNQIGYRNLCKLISFSYQKGFYFKPRIDYAILEQYNEGLIVTSACLGGHIPSLLMSGQDHEADRRIEWFLRVFGKERFYLEVQPPDQEEQRQLNKKLFAISAKKDINLLATADCHYLRPEYHEAHEVFLSIQTQHKITDPNRFSFGDARCFMRTQQEMLELFEEHPQAVWNSGKIADMCNFEFPTGQLFFPSYAIPQNYTQETYFNHLCTQGLEELIRHNLIATDQIAVYKERLETEVSLITSMGFIGYFLIVSDFIIWAKNNSIPVGPGRGSAAGSLVAWTLKITNVDPIKYNLLFERFLNPERISMPDIDIDFCIEGRERVIQYVRDRYGHDHVGQIITFGTLMAKGVLKDVARVLGFPFEDSNAISSLIPDQLKITLAQSLEQEPRLNELVETNPQVRKIFDIAFRLEGLTRHASKHAAGIVISPEPIDQVLPIYIPSKSTEIVTQYAMAELEAIGFLKIDLLGLKNLTIIDRTLKHIIAIHNATINLDYLPLDDEKTFQLLCAGRTSAVFQFESKGIKEVLIKLQPDKFEDLIAVNALYRPGPLGAGMVDDYIARRHGKQKITYIFDELEPILKETYGIIVYQEQVMNIASVIGGYSLGESDILRRAMGKKKVDVMAQQRQIFLERAKTRGFNAQSSIELFDLMAYFADYGFNKSHSTAYALIAYHTAYLKAHYPAEFMASVISLESGDAESMAFYLHEAKECGVAILAPDINTSSTHFCVENNNIRFGLQGIKNIGRACIDNIITQRTADGPFRSLQDFCQRVDLRTSNKRILENLICAGAFDTLPGSRAQQCNDIPLIIEKALEYKKRMQTGQLHLFVTPQGSSISVDEQHVFSATQEWDSKTTLQKEYEVIGFFLSAHPLDAYKNYKKWLACTSLKTLNTTQQVTLYGMISAIKTVITKKGERMAFASYEDDETKAELILFPKVFSASEQWHTQYSIFLIKGFVDTSNPQLLKIKVSHCVPLEKFFEAWPERYGVCIELHQHYDALLLYEHFKNITAPSTTPLRLTFKENDQQVYLETNAAINGQLLKTIEPLVKKISISV